MAVSTGLYNTSVLCLVGDGQSRAATGGDAGEAQGSKVYGCHRSSIQEAQHVVQDHVGKPQDGQETESKSKGKTKARACTGHSRESQGRAGETVWNWLVGIVSSGSKVHGWSQMPGTWPWGD